MKTDLYVFTAAGFAPKDARETEIGLSIRLPKGMSYAIETDSARSPEITVHGTVEAFEALCAEYGITLHQLRDAASGVAGKDKAS